MTMKKKVEWQSMEDDERVAAVLSYACRDYWSRERCGEDVAEVLS